MIGIILLILIIIGIIKWKPYIDIFKDYTDKYHIIIWYNKGKERKYYDLLGSH